MGEAAVTALDAFWKNSPYAAACLVCAVKASVADLIAQKRQKRMLQKDQKIDIKRKDKVKRNVAYVLYGIVYQGAMQEFLYNYLYPKWFGSGSSPQVILTKVAFNLLVTGTLVALPAAYLMKAFIMKYSVKVAMQKYYDDIVHHGLLKHYLLLWVPVQCFTFKWVPAHLRVSFIALVSFFWMILLSSIASKPPVVTVKRTQELCTDSECKIDYEEFDDVFEGTDDDAEYNLNKFGGRASRRS